MDIIKRRTTMALALAATALLVSAAAASAAVTYSPTSINFAKQKVGKKSAPVAVSVTGVGCGPDFGMPIQPGPCFPQKMDVAVSGDFVITGNTCPMVLTSGTTMAPTCTVSVAFKPKSKGKKKGFLRLQSTPSIVGVPLSGKGCKKKNGKFVCK